MTTSMVEAVIFGSPEPRVRYAERRAAYVVVVGDDGKVAAVRSRGRHFLPGGGSLPGEHELDWLPAAEAERACFHACHAWAIRRARETGSGARG